MFQNKYPYTDFHELNLDWMLQKLTETQVRIDELKDEILAATKEYADQEIDTKIAAYQQQIDGQIAALNLAMSNLEISTQLFTQRVNDRMTLQDAKFNEYDDRLDNVIVLANHYTDTAIAQNNDYIIEETTRAFGAIRVLNQFTGLYVTIQEMFDYLGNFHLTDAITVNTLVQRQKTVNDLIALQLLLTDIVVNGNNVII